MGEIKIHTCEDALDNWASNCISVLVTEIKYARTRADVDKLVTAIIDIRRTHQADLWEARHFDGTNPTAQDGQTTSEGGEE